MPFEAPHWVPEKMLQEKKLVSGETMGQATKCGLLAGLGTVMAPVGISALESVNFRISLRSKLNILGGTSEMLVASTLQVVKCQAI